jgi:hypothetical protein
VRQRDPNDRRAYAVQPTDQGRQRLDAAHAATRDLGAHLFGWLSDQDRRRLHATLHRIIQAAQSPSHGDRHWPSTSASKKDNGANVARRDTRASATAS